MIRVSVTSRPPQAAPLAGTRLSVLRIDARDLLRAPSLDAVGAHIQERVRAGERLVIVQGGSTSAGDASPGSSPAGAPRDPFAGPAMLVRSLLNTRLVADLVSRGVPAIGLTGIDLGLGPGEDDAGGGRHWRRLQWFLEDGLVPVLAPIGAGARPGEARRSSRRAAAAPGELDANALAVAAASYLGATGLELLGPAGAGESGPGLVLSAGELAERLDRGDAPAATALGGQGAAELRAAVAAVRKGIVRVRVGSLTALRRGLAMEVTACA